MSIVIPTWRRASTLAQTLQELAHQSDTDFEVVVVCDGEEAETRALSRSYTATFPLRWLFLEKNSGLAAARNAGAQAAKGELLLFLDDDMSLAGDAVAEHKRLHRAAAPGLVVVCGKIVDAYSSPPRSFLEHCLRELREEGLSWVESEILKNEFGTETLAWCGTNCSIRRAQHFENGGYDPRIRLSEDIEFGFRLQSRGAHFLFAPAALAYHRSSKDLVEYTLEGLRIFGADDLYRGRRGQRVPQTSRLASMWAGGSLHRAKESLAWHFPGGFRALAALCAQGAEATGSKFMFRWWHRLQSAGYWEGVRAQGMSLEDLRELVGFPTPVLLLHSISAPRTRAERQHHLSPQRFQRCMHYLKAAGYRSLTSREWLGAAPASHSVWLTFDDGYQDFYVEVFPLLQRLGLNATVFVVADRIGGVSSWDEANGLPPRPLMSAVQLRELHRHGFEIGSHSLTHPWLPSLSEADLRREVAASKALLEDLLGAPVTCFAYPSGGLNPRVRAAVAEAGYKIAMSCDEGLSFWDDPLCLKRVGLGDNDMFLDFLLKLALGRSIRRELWDSFRSLLYDGVLRLPRPVSALLLGAARGMRGS